MAMAHLLSEQYEVRAVFRILSNIYDGFGHIYHSHQKDYAFSNEILNGKHYFLWKAWESSS